MNYPTPEQIEAVRRDWPHWDTAMIVRHLRQRAELSRLADAQRGARYMATGRASS